MNDLLEGSQTLLGVIATLAIVCLFIHDGNNFIFGIITSIGNDVYQNIMKVAAKINDETYKKMSDVYNKSGLSNAALTSNSVVSYIRDKYKNNDTNAQRLLSQITKIDMINRQILNVSKLHITSMDNYTGVFIDNYKKREEAQMMSLMVFVSSIVILLLDILRLDYSLAVPFTWFFILNLLAFSIMMWQNHFSHDYNEKMNSDERRLWTDISCGMASVIVPNFIFVLFLYLPFNYLSILLSISCYVVISIVLSLFMMGVYWKCHHYSKTIVLKHVVYFIISAIFGVGLVWFMTKYYTHSNIAANIEFFHNPYYVRCSLFVILLLDLIIIPIYGGFLHFKVDEFMAIKRVKKETKHYIDKLDIAMDELYDIISDEKSKGNL